MLWLMMPHSRLQFQKLTHRSGLTDRAGLRLLNLAENGIIGINHLGIFVYGETIEGLSDEVFTKWISFLLSVGDKSAVSNCIGASPPLSCFLEVRANFTL